MSTLVISTVKQLSTKYPALPEGGIRHQIFHSDGNGLSDSGAIIRNGRRILIDEEKYFFWLRGRKS